MNRIIASFVIFLCSIFIVFSILTASYQTEMFVKKVRNNSIIGSKGRSNGIKIGDIFLIKPRSNTQNIVIGKAKVVILREHMCGLKILNLLARFEVNVGDILTQQHIDKFNLQKSFQEKAIATLYNKPDSINLIFNAIKQIVDMQKNEFEKSYEFQKRKEEAIRQFPSNKIYSVEIQIEEATYDADNECWNIRLKEGDYLYRNKYLKSYQVNEEFEIKSMYEGANAFGVKAQVVESLSTSYCAYSKYSNNLFYLNLPPTKSQIKMSMSLEKATKYGKNPSFNFRFAFIVDNNFNNPEIIATEAYDSGNPTINNPHRFYYVINYLKVNQLALMVYENLENPKLIFFTELY